MTPRTFNPPSMLRTMPQRPSTMQARPTRETVKVLQSNRTPTQLSLFGRPGR